MYGIEYLIYPYKINDFVKNFLNEKSLHILGHSKKFSELFTWNDVNYLINYGTLDYPRTRLALDKEVLPQEALENIDYWLRQGATLIIDHLEKKHPKIYEFSAYLHRNINTNIQINCYVSQPGKQGFDCHYDTHDVFIIQIQGKKTWFISEPTIKYPLKRQKKITTTPPESPYLECSLAEGDVLYIPKGHWHYAIAVEPSIHLTIGILSRTGIDFLKWMVDELRDEELFRKNLPIVLAGEQEINYVDENLKQQVNQITEKLIEYLQTNQNIVEKFIEYCIASDNIGKNLQLPYQANIEHYITEKTKFQKPLGQRAFIKYDEAKNSIVVTVRGKVLTFDNSSKDLINMLFLANNFSGEEILNNCPNFTWEEIKVILVSLYENRLIFLKDCS